MYIILYMTHDDVIIIIMGVSQASEYIPVKKLCPQHLVCWMMYVSIVCQYVYSVCAVYDAVVSRE